ncbi:uncharacterized protein STEHIDRAFT_155146 [Stereum hirsutum FP-91666 SS1]|uniref:uncharacterized protein n=1 Tax=Stereum hirsutum (strain FP-91666) TaxID=721885 RepID=UPI000440B989|nr:uncharacterized protein STEHIDRAFT_155146 [Stereum hirsutum FP-91666 SS1]EIM87773.1 hypothetical protein STEHIDRAFT_155146 [Stereum hirsutum FP-91666 SS1]
MADCKGMKSTHLLALLHGSSDPQAAVRRYSEKVLAFAESNQTDDRQEASAINVAEASEFGGEDFGGKNTGIVNECAMIDVETRKRVYSAAYLQLTRARENLEILKKAEPTLIDSKISPYGQISSQTSKNPEFAAKQVTIYDSAKRGWLTATDSTAVFNPFLTAFMIARNVGNAHRLSAIGDLKAVIADERTITPLREKQFDIQTKWQESNTVAHTEMILYLVVMTVVQVSSFTEVAFNTSTPWRIPQSTLDISVTNLVYLDDYLGCTQAYKRPTADHTVLLSAVYQMMEELDDTRPPKNMIERHVVPRIPLADPSLLVHFASIYIEYITPHGYGRKTISMVIVKMDSLEPLRDTADPLPILNERAAQIQINIQWAASSRGPPHLPSWTVRCLLNNVERGVGNGASKQTAKRAAAHQALYTMGWIRGATSTFQPGHGYVQSPNVLANVAADKGLRLDWYIYKVGPDHLISWRAQCTIDGGLKGEGRGGRLIEAKRRAARQAFLAMGWVTAEEDAVSEAGSEASEGSSAGSTTVIAYPS